MKSRKIVTIITVLVMAFTVFAMTPDTASAYAGKYWLKVNTQMNVVNVYKKSGSKWKPYKVMLCSCGNPSTPTPIGTFSIKKKWRWTHFDGSAGQYVSQFNGNYLFHSDLYMVYGNPATCVRASYNKLGSVASHGCIRLATMDAKWIYQNCCWGTKVTTYKSSKAGPLGKPKRVAMAGKKSLFWDPTDNTASNKYFMMKGPTIKISQKKKDRRPLEYGAKFKIKSGVTAKSPYTYQNLTSKIKVAKVRYRAEGTDKYVKLDKKWVNTKKPGTYIITYTCYDKYCGPKAVKTFKVTVLPKPVDPEEPTTEPEVPTDPSDPTVEPGDPGTETTDPSTDPTEPGTDMQEPIANPEDPSI